MFTSVKLITLRTTVLFAAALLATLPAFAHHPMGEVVPATWWHGLQSGFGHPIIALDHLAFLVGAAVVVALSNASNRQAFLWLTSYAVAGAMGTALQAMGVNAPWTEFAVVASLAAIALCLWVQRVPGFYVAALMASAAGLAHGYAYGEAVIGAEATPLVAYLTGLALVQTALLAVVFKTLRPLLLIAPLLLPSIFRALGVLVAFVAAWSGMGLIA